MTRELGALTLGGNQHLGFQDQNQDFLPYIIISRSLAIEKLENIFLLTIRSSTVLREHDDPPI
jgi:hypothetical protein